MENISIKQKRVRRSEPRFNIESKADRKTPSLLFLVYRYKQAPENKTVLLKYSTGLKIPKANFDQKLQRTKIGVRFSQVDSERANKLIRKIYDGCLMILESNPSIAKGEFKLELDYLLGVEKRPLSKNEYSVLDYFNLYIRNSRNDERTIMKYMAAKNHFSEFEIKINSGPTYFDQINPEFAERFSKYLFKTKKHSINNASKIIQILRQVIKDAYENGYHQNHAFQSDRFLVKRVKTTKHFLELDELVKLKNLDLSDNESLSNTRWLWLIGAYTGLRISDLKILNKSHFKNVDGVEVIDINTFKGRNSKDNKVIIPILPQLKEILEQLDYELPKSYSVQKMNDYIKDVCEIAELNRNVETTISKSGKIKIVQTPLFKKITNHSSRYTFINIMVNDFEIPAFQLKKITGQSLKTLEGYERGNKSKNAVKVQGKVKKKLLEFYSKELKVVS